ncbi:protein-disulfide reductase DsbD domain-containing protein [Hyphobacterium sp. HN65]|uniref:Protein-disulfide reductase DsbD domain-containing protein n=1 Tax=Hyphobacterium lacteum TaxID=3116575 RepID=A0ABU7LN84_9PROT|nr:protein-disulfide reductase DsbD domain-containing protein [Hyphobacterium sp. HN65]MEE2525383.1 protein-disulfide reductase DsbD domain-containing protein [Hyphobacterium sp. HN65]
MIRFFSLLLVFLTAAGLAAAQSSSIPRSAMGQDAMVDVQLVADHVTVEAGQTFHVGLLMDIEPGWHTYWRNPGDSGEATRINWRLPEGVEASDIIWPAPSAYEFGHLMNYGYGGEIVLPVSITVPSDFDDRFLGLRADVSWLVCEEVCIPESAEVDLFLTVNEEAVVDEGGAALIRAGLERVPAESDASAGIKRHGQALLLTVALPTDDAGIRNPAYFPYADTVISHAADQRAYVSNEGIALRLTPAQESRSGLTWAPRGVLTFEIRENNGWAERSIVITPEPGTAVIDVPSEAFMEAMVPVTAAGLVVTLLLSLLGGLILNLMPCVFPVLSIKALGFVERAHSAPGELRRHGLLFLAGVLVTFLVLAAVLLVFKSIGNPIGWGFQLQNPVAVSILSMIMFAIGLNLVGLFEVGTSVQGVGSRWSNMSGDAGAFMTGLLAVVVAAPCIGPFAAGALGLAFSQPGYVLVLVSLMLGIGLALPYLILSFFPALLKWLPKPGPWMVRFKQFLAFPMFGAGIWLIWVLAIQAGPQGVLMLMIGYLALGFLIWTLKSSGLLSRIATGAGAVALAFTLYGVAQSAVPGEYSGEPWSQDRVDMLLAEGRPVFIDFTAAWCVSCQFNKQVTLNSRSVLQAFEENEVQILIADWTNRDDRIADAIRGYGAAGIPLYVYYPAGAQEPVILPPLLNTGQLIELVSQD